MDVFKASPRQRSGAPHWYVERLGIKRISEFAIYFNVQDCH